MTHEATKALARRLKEDRYKNVYFVGKGVDIGAGDDNLGNHLNKLTNMVSVDYWDLPQGDAQYMATVDDETYDFIHSSHTLEHLVDPATALSHWIRILKTGGYGIVTVPEWEMYEKCFWPSRFNNDHKWAFYLGENPKNPHTRLINVHDLLKTFEAFIETESVSLLDETYDRTLPDNVDQTLMPHNECAIEFVFKKIAPITEEFSIKQ